MKTISRGFSLIELMVALVVVAILAAFAIPSYTESVRKSKRADAQSSLLKVQLEQEKYRASNTTYGTLVQISVSSASSDGYYTISVSGNTATGYIASAVPTGSQVSDSCGTLSLTVLNGNMTYSSSSGTASTCWGK